MENTSLLAAGFMTYALAYTGMAVLCLAMEKHYAQVMQREDLSLNWKKSLKAVGWGLLILGLFPSISGWGLTIGIVVWIGFISVTAISVVIMLAYFPAQFLRIGASTMGLGLLLSLLFW